MEMKSYVSSSRGCGRGASPLMSCEVWKLMMFGRYILGVLQTIRHGFKFTEMLHSTILQSQEISLKINACLNIKYCILQVESVFE